MTYDICSIGHVTHDKVETPHLSTHLPGGTAFYMSCAIGRLPRRVSYQLVTKVSTDHMEGVEMVRRMGLDTVCYPSRHTTYFVNIYGDDSDKRSQRVLETSDPFTIDDVKPLHAKIFHLGALLADDFTPEVVEELAGKGIVSIDIQGYLRKVVDTVVYPVVWKDKDRILPLTGILKLNEDEAKVVTCESDVREAARQLAKAGVSEVIITLGSHGSLIYADGAFHEIPVFKVDNVVDATGSGDTYSAGYLYSRAQGADYDEAGRFASAMCALKLKYSGPFDGTIDDVFNLMKTADGAHQE